MQLFFFYTILNLIALEANTVFMNGFQSISIGPQDSVHLFCLESVNATEISQITWYQSAQGQLNELQIVTNSFEFKNITENTLIICQYTYFYYKYWFEIFLITINTSKCHENRPNEITTLTTHQTVQYFTQPPVNITNQTDKSRIKERMASKQPSLSSGEMKTSDTFTFATCAICHAIFIIFHLNKNN